MWTKLSAWHPPRKLTTHCTGDETLNDHENYYNVENNKTETDHESASNIENDKPCFVVGCHDIGYCAGLKHLFFNFNFALG